MASEVIGRGDELEAIQAFLAEPAPSALLLDGDAGIGKTSLWRLGIELADEAGQRVLAARPAAAEAELSFAGLADLLADCLDDVLPGLPQPQRRALEVALLRVEERGNPPDPRAIGTGVLGALGALARHGEVLVAIDDLQWLDAASAAALTFAARRLRAEPIRFLLTQRSSPDAEPAPLRGALSEERLRRLHVEPLSPGAVAHVVRTRLDVTFPRRIFRRIYATSGGNPFFALELSRALDRRGGSVDPDESLPVPPTLHGLVVERMADLPPRTREALLLAALASQPTLDLVDRALGDAWKRLRPAVEAETIELDEGHIRFAHPLIASVAEADAGQRRVRETHHRLAELVEDPEERALHLSLAAEGPDEAVASALEDAARTSAARGAPDIAALFAERAMRLTPPGRDVDTQRRAVLASEHHFDSGALERARALLEDVVENAPRGSIRLDALMLLSNVRFQQEGVVPGLEPQLAALEEAGDDIARRAAVETTLAWGFHVAGDLDGALEHARAGAELAERAGDPETLAPALAILAMTEFIVAHGVRWELLERAVALEPPRALPLNRARWIFAMLLELTCEFGRSRTMLESLVAQSRERGEDLELPYLLNHLARVALRAGDWAAAERFAREARDLTLELGARPEESFTVSTCALVDACRGRVDQARAQLKRGLELAERTGMTPARFELLTTAGFLELSVGDAKAAARALEPLPHEAAAAGFREPSVFRFQGDQIEALVALGRLDEAEALLGPFETSGGRWGTAVAGRSRGLLQAARGDVMEALATLQGARESVAALGEPLELARTQLALGAVQRRTKQRKTARESLAEARTIFQQLGAELWVERARHELARIGGRAPSDGALTPMERRVAELVSAGKSNREAAAELVVTVRTIETHLSRIYRKLGVRSRTELAAQAARLSS